MKKLDEVEPRTNLQANPPPVGVDTSNAGYHFIINQPGSYYLSSNVDVTKTNGIQINAEGVTLDLNGFQIARSSGTGGDGIVIFGDRAGIRNGSIKGFSNGIRNPVSRGCGFSDLTVSGCTSVGIDAGDGAVIRSCGAHDNSGSYGIRAGSGSSLINCTASGNTTTVAIESGDGSSLTNCSAYNNAGTYGIFAGAGSSLTNCAAHNNSSTSPLSAGIAANLGSTVTDCTAHRNLSAAPATATTGMGFNVGGNSTIKGCTARLNRGDGIQAGVASTVSGCTANDNGMGAIGSGISAGNRASITGSTTNSNKADGIRVLDGGTVSGCTANDNGGKGISVNNGCQVIKNTTRKNASDGIYANFSCLISENSCNGDGDGADGGYGIHVVGQANRVDSNNVTFSVSGNIKIDDASNIIVRNSCHTHGPANYQIAGGNTDAEVLTLGTGFTATNPWANFAY